MIRRCFLVVCDSLGVGALPDAHEFGDAGTHTLDHLARAAGGLHVPNLARLGLGNITGVESVPARLEPEGAFGRCAELSIGKDTTTGHWEMMGLVSSEAFPTFPDGFPPEILDPFVERTGIPGVLCNTTASGTEVIARLGEEHLESGKPIVYTSADSVFQIATHEEGFGLERLYELCAVAREILTPYRVARVIARPFVGRPGSFERTYNRRDYSLEPTGATTLDFLTRHGVPVVGIGKIHDLFAGQGVAESIHTKGNEDGMRVLIDCARQREHGLFFVNLIDFDMLFGHRRDAPGYRAALERFDEELGTLETCLRPGDLVVLTADHGNDPTHLATTDHTREYVPLLAFGPGLFGAVDLGTRSSFADVGRTIAEAFGAESSTVGCSFAHEIGAS